MVYGDTKEVAAFNLAMPYLTRINSILNSNYTEFRNANARTFAINLRQLYRELRPWLVVDPIKKVDEVSPIMKEFDKLSRIKKGDGDRLWKQLEEIEMIMRTHFKKLGMLMPKVSDPRYLFGNKQK